MKIVTTSYFDHFNINTQQTHFYASFCIFVGCQALDGGALYSNLDIDHHITFCIFSSCNATNRGGALLIQKGNIYLNNICSTNCNAEGAADMQCWDETLSSPDEYCIKTVLCENIQAVGCHAKNHPTYFSSSILKLKYINTSLHSIDNEANTSYCNGICFCYKHDFCLKYFNCINCNGGKGIIHFECCLSGEYSIYSINEINNQPYQSIFSSQAMEDSILIHVYNSYFVDNTASSMLFNLDESSYDIFQLNFYECLFTGNQLGSQESYTNCEFNQEFDAFDTQDIQKCFIFINQTQNLYKNPIFYIIFVFVVIIS